MDPAEFGHARFGHAKFGITLASNKQFNFLVARMESVTVTPFSTLITKLESVSGPKAFDEAVIGSCRIGYCKIGVKAPQFRPVLTKLEAAST